MTTTGGQIDRELFARLYAELRELARRRLANERAGHTLDATSLVHEVFLRLDGAITGVRREELLAIAATAMRRVLVDSARRKILRRRPPEESADVESPPLARDEALLRLDLALEKLGRHDPELLRVVELRWFAELGVDEVAEVLGVSAAKVKRDWRAGRAFLQVELEREGA